MFGEKVNTGHIGENSGRLVNENAMVLSFSSLPFLTFEILTPFQRQDKIPESKSVAQGTRTRLPSLNTKENTEQTELVWEYLQEKIY